MKITLIDDDENITASLKLLLESENYSVTVFHDGTSGLEGLATDTPQLVILDIKMPRMDGLEMLKQLRGQGSNVPVIMLTSKDDEIDEVLALKLGADDYITKPFSQRLLLARIEAVLKRSAQSAAAPTQQTAEKLQLDEARYEALWNGKRLNLTVTEFLLLQALAKAPGIVKSRNQLMDDAYGESMAVDDRAIDTHIRRIRAKFREVDSNFENIQSLYGAGYKWTE
ncbi:MAG: response regulator [Alphaproteobacteria bacterium]|nr:response regulator [Alphaproteobacteria bacterium]